jgi:lipoate---protein ligase
MHCINLKTPDPFFNLAVEEYLLKKKEEDYLIIGINNPSVIIGKHQVVHREVNAKFVIENNIPVIRRISGGGTVFHDNGNLNFTFIQLSEKGKQIDFRKYTLPVINFLSTLGVNAIFEGKSDITFDGFKISGNAEHVYKDRVLHHGTLLFDTSLENLREAIRQDTFNYTTRAVGSKRTIVTNIKDKLLNVSDIFEFRALITGYFLKNITNAGIYTLSNDEMTEAESLAESKYRTWEWNYAYGPEYIFHNNFGIHGKSYTCRLVVKDGIIWECSIEGSNEMLMVSKHLIGCRHMYSDMLKVFRTNNVAISDDQIFSFF